MRAVINHGIPIEDIRSMFQASVDFFALPDDIKRKYPMDISRNAGWEKLAQVNRYQIIKTTHNELKSKRIKRKAVLTVTITKL